MAARPYWSGRIRLALVTIPVDIVPATKSSSRISFNQIHEPSGKRIRYEKVVPGIGPVDAEDIVKGYEVDKGKYVLLSDEEIDDVKLEAKKSIDLVQFVDEDEIAPIYFERPFYILPDEKDEDAEEAYAVLRDALRKTKKVGLGQVVVRGQGSIVAIKPFEKGLLMETLRYADEVKKPEQVFDGITKKTPDKDLVELAQELIEKKSGDFQSGEIQGHLHGRVEGIDRREAREAPAEGDRGNAAGVERHQPHGCAQAQREGRQRGARTREQWQRQSQRRAPRQIAWQACAIAAKSTKRKAGKRAAA